MITIKLTFLIALNLQEPEKSPKTPRGRKENQRKSKGSSKSTNTSKSSKSQKAKSRKATEMKEKGPKSSGDAKISDEQVPDYEIRVGNPLKFVHIEYVLISTNLKYRIDVVCWGPVAKICTASETRYFKTFMKDDTAYVPVFVVHYLDELPTNDLLKFKDNVLSFSFSTDKKKVPAKSRIRDHDADFELSYLLLLEIKMVPSFRTCACCLDDNCFAKKMCALRARNDKSRKLFIKNKDVGSTDFVESFLENPNTLQATDHNVENDEEDVEKNSLCDEIEHILLECINRVCKKEIAICMNRKDKVHLHKVHEIIQKTSLGKEILCKDSIMPESGKAGSAKANNQRQKKNKKGGNKARDTVMIPAEVLFTDPVFAIYKLSETPPRNYKAFVITSSESLLTDQQKTELNPLVVKILKLNNLPGEVLLKNSYDSVFVNCFIPGICCFKTQPKPISPTMSFSEARFICTRMLPQLTVLETLQTKGVVLEVCGLKSVENLDKTGENSKVMQAKKGSGSKKSNSDKSSKKKSSTSGTRSTKKTSSSGKSKSSRASSKTGKNVDNAPIPLAVVKYNLSSLIKNTWIFLEKAQCHMPNVSWCQMRTEIILKQNLVDLLTVNDINYVRDPLRLTVSPLTEDVLLERNTTLQLEAYFLIPQHGIMLFDSFSKSYQRLLLIIVNNNVAKNLVNDVLLHNQQITGKEILIPNFHTRHKCDDLDDMLTGFLIDSGNHCIFFVEGLSDGHIRNLFQQISELGVCIAKTFYNSDYVFEERLYDGFKSMGGLYFITLKFPLEDIFAKTDIYVEGNLPLLCWRAILKLNLIYNTTTFESALFYNLLPTQSEFASLALECGLELRFKIAETRQNLVPSSSQSSISVAKLTTVISHKQSLSPVSSTASFMYDVRCSK